MEDCPETPISLNKAAKKYGIPQTTLSNWAKIGRIKVLQRPERKGQPLLVDEVSVILAREASRYKKSKLKKCPLCGQSISGGPGNP